MHQIQRYFRKAGKAVLRFFGRVAHGSVLDIAILVCGVGLVGVGTTIAVVSSQKPQQVPVDVSSTVPVSVSASVSVPPVQQEVYDPNENALDLAEYSGTLLAESTDGGEAYLNETIFIGDSNTYRLATYGLTSWQNNLSAVGMGIQHVTSTPSMYFKGMDNPVYMARAVALMQPRRIVITYGTNNTDSSAETFKNQYRTALEAIKKEWPYADIIINAIPPVAAFRSNAINTQKNIDAFNKALAELAKEDGYQFLNSSEVLRDPSTGFARTDYMIGDGLHLNEDGAKALMSYVRTHTHIVADTRPARTELPIHQPTPEELFNPQAASGSSSSSSQTDGITVTFSIRGDKAGGKLEGTLMQLVEPGKTCSPVTATANAGYTMAWGCDVGGLYEGQGLTTNGNQTTVNYTVPTNTTEKTLNVWVTFSTHTHTYADNDWKDQGNGTHAHWCTDPKCPDEQKGVVAENHTWNAETGTCTVCGAPCGHTWDETDAATGMRKCTVCGKQDKDSNWTAPHTHTASSYVEAGTGHQAVCAGCGETYGDVLAHEYDNNYINNGDGTHTRKCIRCGGGAETAPHGTYNYTSNDSEHTGCCAACGGDVKTEGHTFTDGKCSVCGHSQPTPPESPEIPET